MMQVADDNEVIASSAKLMQRNEHVYEVLANGEEAIDRSTFESAQIAPFLTNEKTWVRDYAGRYMQRYGKSQ